MFGSIMAAILLLATAITREPSYAIAAGLFELAGIIYSITRPKRFKEGAR